MMKPYPEYKATGLQWLPKIPKHWELFHLRNLLSVVSEKNHPEKPLLSVVRERGIILRNIEDKEENHNYIPDDLTNYKLVKVGQFAMNKMKAWQGSYGISPYEGIVSPAYFVFNLKGVSPAFFHRAIRSKAYISYFGQASDGIRVGQWDLSLPRMREIPFFIPPSNEQSQIVRYLDAITAKINKLISAKKKQVALLQEQKQAIINQAVTQGLDPNAKYQSTEVTCASLIPSTWGVRQLGKVATIILSGLDKKSYDGQQKVKLCNYVDVYRNDYITNEINFMQATASDSEIKSLSLQKGDVVITKDSESWDDIAVPAYITDDITDLCCGYHLAILRSKRLELFPEFLFYAFRGQYVQVQHKVKAKGVTRFALGNQPIHDTILCLPPLDEQQDIVMYIKDQCKSQDRYIEVLNEEITKLREYQNSLVSAVVTGKIDVRGLAVEDVVPEDVTIDDEEAGEDVDEEMTEAESEG